MHGICVVGYFLMIFDRNTLDGNDMAKSTEELEEILKNTHHTKAAAFIEETGDSFVGEDEFARYMRATIKAHGRLQQEVFLYADISERYGYKIISGEKRTEQRDTIIRICYAAEFSLDETQHALKLYGMPELYARMERDALIMIAFNERPGSIIEVNQFLRDNRAEALRPCGVQN